MTRWKPLTKLFIAAAAGATALLAMTGSAFAGTADYPSTGTFGVPNNTGQAGIPSQVFVPRAGPPSNHCSSPRSHPASAVAAARIFSSA
jgi:hypothetical protein